MGGGAGGDGVRWRECRRPPAPGPLPNRPCTVPPPPWRRRRPHPTPPCSYHPDKHERMKAVVKSECGCCCCLEADEPPPPPVCLCCCLCLWGALPHRSHSALRCMLHDLPPLPRAQRSPLGMLLRLLPLFCCCRVCGWRPQGPRSHPRWIAVAAACDAVRRWRRGVDGLLTPHPRRLSFVWVITPCNGIRRSEVCARLRGGVAVRPAQTAPHSYSEQPALRTHSLQAYVRGHACRVFRVWGKWPLSEARRPRLHSSLRCAVFGLSSLWHAAWRWGRPPLLPPLLQSAPPPPPPPTTLQQATVGSACCPSCAALCRPASVLGRYSHPGN